ncbi:PucR family transcriptional regulator [Falsigemmobacter faecalis]|uniref:PucR family transcriptional regulator n=1 Tax=Falsigemmobacter faecalis TaxID=2488730 RepID=A0A3P3DFZ5_9RHOB|nr:PucR family transcriptional regulator [Falsigemmobacter faecalis]RRH73185.1 PucR family transcriptional regulator [Falsigemmobacter faecalis]
MNDILKWEMLKGSHILAGDRMIRNAVRSVTVLDAPDAMNWVKPQEFVVTTTFPLQSDPTALVALLEGLSQRSAAGLGVKLTRYLRDIPSEVLRRADDLGLPIISLPGSLAWSDLIHAIFSRLRDSAEDAELGVLYRTFSQYRSLPVSFEAISHLLGDFLRAPFLLLAETESGTRVTDRGLSYQQLSEWRALLTTSEHMPSDGPDAGPKSLRPDGLPLISVREKLSSGAMALVAIESPDSPAAGRTDLECLRLVRPLLQELLRNEADQSKLQNSRLNPFERAFAEVADPSVSLPLREELARSVNTSESRWRFIEARLFLHDRQKEPILDFRLQQYIRRHELCFWSNHAQDGHYRFALCARQELQVDEAILRGLTDLFTRHCSGAEAPQFALGVSRPGAFRDALSLMHEAETALALGSRLSGPNRMTNYRDVLLADVLSDPAVKTALHQAFHAELSPLEGAAELRETLRVWLDEGESLSRTAARLGLHVNSVRHRLDRTRRLLGFADFSTADKVRLFLALHLRP